jgi:hypothetical protein
MQLVRHMFLENIFEHIENAIDIIKLNNIVLVTTDNSLNYILVKETCLLFNIQKLPWVKDVIGKMICLLLGSSPKKISI